MNSPDGSKGYWATLSNPSKSDVYCYVWIREGEQAITPAAIVTENKEISERYRKKLDYHYQLPKKSRRKHFMMNFELELKAKFKVRMHTSAYSFYTPEFGTIDYYATGGKVLIRKENRWIDRGLEWIVKNFLD